MPITLSFGEENIDGERPYVNNYADKPQVDRYQLLAVLLVNF